MKLAVSHPWNLTPSEAIQLQKDLRQQILVTPLNIDKLSLVGGVDVGFREGKAHAAAVVLGYPSLTLIEHASVELPVTFPYIPGLLSFRETPAVLAALEQLSHMPDALLCDGHGYAHPRRFGIACHLGMLLDLPVVGIGKSILVGSYDNLGIEAGSTAELIDHEEVIGMAIRTRQGVKPIFASIGNRVDLPSAVQLTLRCVKGHRLPEPIRLADRLASRRGPIE